LCLFYQRNIIVLLDLDFGEEEAQSEGSGTMSPTDDGARRIHVRKGFYGLIEGVVRGSTFFATIQDLSLGGVCFEVDYPFRSGLNLHLTFRVFDDQEPIEVKAEVVWVQPSHMLFSRVGAKFTELGPKATRIINAYVSSLKTEPEKGDSGPTKYPLIFSPFKISNVTLKNRLTMAPMFWGYADEDGTVSQRLIDCYREIALGGVGMIVVANAVIDTSGIMASRVLRIDQDRFVPGLTELAKSIKSSGVVACLQINHAGRWAKAEKPLAPSPAAMDISAEMSGLDGIHEDLSGRHRMRLVNKYLSALMRCRQGMTLEEIESIKESYGQAALRARKAGFDMVELHGATGYLLVQFLSARSNKRSDSYGGSLENRMRFPLEVVETVKGFVGDDFPVGYRFLADECLANGFDIEEAKVFAQNLERTGIAYVSVTAGTYESFFLPEVINRCRKEGYIADLARQIKEVVSTTPVIAAGRIIRPAMAERMLSNKEADLIGLARTLFADPRWPNKVFEGRDDEIIYCKCCNTCFLCVVKDEPVICARWDKFKRMELYVELQHKREKWEKILIAMDESEGSLAAVEYAGRMIGKGHKVTLFNVITTEQDIEIAKNKMEDFLSQVKGHLLEMGISERDIDIKVATKEKGVAEDILEEVKRGEYGSIILGKRGISWARQLLFGSVSSHIVQHAEDCAVWVID
jgi:2,4-dienoyl-CoA reductase-like NADH-dependent reductase (Old Yellow Enzyme family)/nucleotide-binding universal stress UspA family protein